MYEMQKIQQKVMNSKIILFLLTVKKSPQYLSFVHSISIKINCLKVEY